MKNTQHIILISFILITDIYVADFTAQKRTLKEGDKNYNEINSKTSHQ